ncbi:MAG: hypothetical protein J6A25_09360 [Lachnospiraceae bacterium]|nr:hypothetical protein [Lachnospiraceae bacterium]
MDEQLTNVSSEEMSNDSVDYVAAINELKQNSVSKERYNKLEQDNKRLLDALVNNKQIDIQEKPKVDVAEARRNLAEVCETGCTQLEFFDKVLALRTAVLESGGPDPFLPVGSKVQPTYEQIERQNEIHAGIQDMIDFAEGDPGIFNAEYQRRVVDTMPQLRKTR